METPLPPRTDLRPTTGRALMWLGLGLLLLGPVLYVLQFRAKVLSVPWYVPALATTGAVLALVAVCRRFTIGRTAALIVCGLLAAAEWFLLLSVSKVPAYEGPTVVSQSFPAFRTSLADGSAFDQDGLRGPQNTALVFFRGRW